MNYKKLTRVADSHIADGVKKFDYEAAVRADIRKYVNQKYKRDFTRFAINEEVGQRLLEELVDYYSSDDYASTLDEWRAEEMVCHNLDLLREAVEEYGDNEELGSIVASGAVAMDVAIRIYVVGGVLEDVLSQY